MFEFPRKKPFRFWLSVSYRLYKFSNRVLGRERVLKLLLDLHFVADRLSWESIVSLNSHAAFGDENMSLLMERWISKGSRIIDIGCGDGRLAGVASKYGSVVGIDRHNGFHEHPNVEFRVGDAMDIKERFDVAILSHILEHLDEPEALLSNLQADTVLIEVPNFNHDGRNHYRAKYGLPFYTDNDHVREYTPDDIISQVERNGWVVKDQIINSVITIAATRHP